MNLLITGAAGFIGSHFALRHTESVPDDKIVVLDKLTYAGDKSFLDPILDQITFVEGDICDTELVSTLVKDHQIDVIVNFAAESHVDNSIADPGPFLQTNIMGTQSLINVCRMYPEVKLLHISTDEVHGDVGDDDPACTVGHAMYPSSPYAASKAAAEMLVMAAMRTYGVKASISRCTNNYGPHQASEKFLPVVIRNALADKPIPIYAQGKNKRDWLYVTDHCDALEIILGLDWAFHDEGLTGVHESQPHGGGHIFQISADSEQENIAVATQVLDALGKSHDLLTFVEDRPGHDWRYALDSSAIRKLGWSPKVSFEEGLQKTIEWFQGRS